MYNNIQKKKSIYNNKKLLKNKIKNLSRNKSNFPLNNNFSSYIGKSSNNINKTEYNDNINKNKNGEEQNKNININKVLRNKSLNQIKLKKKNINRIGNNIK